MNYDQLGNEWIGRREPLKALCAEISAVGVRVECFPGGTSPYTGNGDQFATADWHYAEQVWRIYYPARCNAYQIYHELLHVHRHRLQGVPMLTAHAATDVQMIRNITELNNDFDHAHVVPCEVAAYPEAGDYWAGDFDRKLSEVIGFSKDPGGVLQYKLTLLRGWIVLPIALPQAPVTHSYRERLQMNGWYATAEMMTQRIQAAGVDKSVAVSAFRDALGLDFPPTSLCQFT